MTKLLFKINQILQMINLIVEPAKVTGSVISPLCGWMDVWMDVWMDGCNELISETAPPIFLKLGMMLGGQ